MIQKLKKNVCKISVSELEKPQQGTGFLISNKLIMTAYHVLVDANEKLGEIKVHFNDVFYSVTLHKLINEKYKNLDVAILELEEEVDFYQNIDFLDKKLNSNEKWITRGYPLAKDETGEELTHRDCVIHQHLDELSSGNYDIELNLHGKLDSYSGLSGSPIIVDEKIVGFLTKELSDSRVKEFRGVSFKYFKDLIDEVNRKEQNKNEITETIKLENGKIFEIELVKVELEDKILYVGKYPVTFEEYDFYNSDIEDEWGRDKYPIINIDWNNSNLYCEWINRYKKNSSILFRLPTPKEWEEVAEKNFPKKGLNCYLSFYQTKEVTNMEKGRLGIYGMYGNIHEWCYLKKEIEPKVVKGGSFRNSLNYISDVTKITEFFSEEKNEEISFRIIAETVYY